MTPIPKGATPADLINKYDELHAKVPGRAKATVHATLRRNTAPRYCAATLRRDIGDAKLSALSAVVLRDFIDRRRTAGADGVSMATDLSLLSAA